MINYESENSGYLNANPTWHVEDSPWKATQVLKMIERNKLQPKTIVEVGCGAGEILSQLHQRMADKAIEFSGYEIAPEAFKLCLERKKDRLNYFQEDLLQTDKEFDLLLMIDVFEHVDDYIGFIKKAGSKATYKIYHIPLDMCILSLYRNYPMSARKDVGHLHYFMKDTALATLTDAGQEVIDWFYTPFAFELNNKDLTFNEKIRNLLRRFSYWINPDFTVKTFGGFALMVLTK
ncbi:MAG: methyltransferase [Methylococcales bacterium]|nr:methyltransferase [Methylococcales bacterium]MDD5631286.1 methyltransferase [Methylococcales bacterium]